MKHKTIIKNKIIIIAVLFFAAIAVFGLSPLSNNFKSNVKNSKASAQEPADINNDNVVDIFDLSTLLGNWNITGPSTSDLNNDNTVNIFDLSRLLSSWGVVAVAPDAVAGAKLPITYDIATLPGVKRYVATTGNDTTGTGAIGAPYATLAKAISMAATNDSIVIRGGTYREGNISVSASKTLRIAAYPGEIPVFNGAQAYATGWTVEGSSQYKAYTPMPVTDGSGISFTTGQNLTGDGVGKYPDQAWVGNTQLRQVSAKTAVVEGTFWVDSANSRIYLSSADIAKGGVEVSNSRVFLSLSSPNSIIEGLRITRYSNTASDYGVVKIQNTADNATIRNVDISDTSFIAFMLIGDSNLLTGVKLQNMTVSRSNWMGVSAMYTDYLVLDKMDISYMNQFDEFAYSPQSGAFKSSRIRYTEFKNSNIHDNHSHGIWFDQSNYDTDIANNRVVDNLGTGVFYEISDDLLLINNYIRSSGGARAVKLAGASGLKVINNTIIGGADPVGVYTDNRSMPGCADPSVALCANSYSSDRDTVRARPSTLDWMPRIDAMYNNIIVYPTSAGYCGATSATCITVSNSTASAPIQTIIHKADAARGIPQTFIDNNVYSNGTGRLVSTPTGYTALSTFTAAMAASPVSITGIDANSKAGNSWVNADGSPTSTLSAGHNQAFAIPTDADINAYLSAGTKHYGVTY